MVFCRKLYLIVLYINLFDNYEDNDDYGDYNKQEFFNICFYCCYYWKFVSCQGFWLRNINIEFFVI